MFIFSISLFELFYKISDAVYSMLGMMVFSLVITAAQLYIYASLPNVTVHYFPRQARCQLIFSIDRRVIYHLKGLWEYIPKSIPSVCLYHDLQTNSVISFSS